MREAVEQMPVASSAWLPGLYDELVKLQKDHPLAPLSAAVVARTVEVSHTTHLCNMQHVWLNELWSLDEFYMNGFPLVAHFRFM